MKSLSSILLPAIGVIIIIGWHRVCSHENDDNNYWTIERLGATILHGGIPAVKTVDDWIRTMTQSGAYYTPFVPYRGTIYYNRDDTLFYEHLRPISDKESCNSYFEAGGMFYLPTYRPPFPPQLSGFGTAYNPIGFNGVGSGGLGFDGCTNKRCRFLSITKGAQVGVCPNVAGAALVIEANFSPFINEFILDRSTGLIEIINQVVLNGIQDSDGQVVGITGLAPPNAGSITAFYTNRVGDENASPLACGASDITSTVDGMDPSGIQRVRDPTGNVYFAISERYGPSIAFIEASASSGQFGRVLVRYIPEDPLFQLPTAEAGAPTYYPITTRLPAVYNNKVIGGGFGGMACNVLSNAGHMCTEGTNNYKCWAVMDSGLKYNTAQTVPSTSYVYRVLEFDFSMGIMNGQPTAEYVIEKELTPLTSSRKRLQDCLLLTGQVNATLWEEPLVQPRNTTLSAATFIKDKTIAIIEKSSSQVLYFYVNLTDATNVLGRSYEQVEALYTDNNTVGCPMNYLAAYGIKPAKKTLFANSATISGWDVSFNQVGLALAGNTMFTMSDNNFGLGNDNLPIPGLSVNPAVLTVRNKITTVTAVHLNPGCVYRDREILPPKSGSRSDSKSGSKSAKSQSKAKSAESKAKGMYYHERALKRAQMNTANGYYFYHGY